MIFILYKSNIQGPLTFYDLVSSRFWAHVVMAYVFAFWTYFVLYKEYKLIASMRLHFLASEKRRPDQFTVSSLI